MRRVACLVIVLFGVLAARADDPRRVRGGTEMVLDPVVEQKVVARLGAVSVLRDKQRPGTPIVGVDLFGSSKDFEGDVVAMAELPSLRSLSITAGPGGPLTALRRLRQLDELQLLNLTIAKDDLKSLNQLRSLTVAGCVVPDGLLTFAGLTGLRELRLPHYRLTADDVKHLAGLQDLRKLSLKDTNVNDAGLKVIAGLGRLENLDLGSCSKVSGAGLAALSRCPRLEALDLSGCSQVADGDLEEVAKLVGLRRLDLTSCGVTDNAIQHLAGLKHLEALCLYGCESITQAGMLKLAKLDCLRVLDVRDCPGLSKEDVGRLKAALPNCEFIGP